MFIRFLKTINQEEFNMFIKRFEYLLMEFRARNYNLKVDDLKKITTKILKKINSVIYNIGYLVDIKKLKTDFEYRDEEGYYKTYFLFKKNRYWSVVDRIEFNKLSKEYQESHKDLDPYGEDDWTEN